MTDIKKYEPLWSAWYVDGNPIGAGSFGQVYRVHKEEFGHTYYSAVKIMTLPQSSEDLNRVRNDYNDDEASVRSYFKGLVDDIVQEISIMNEFRGNSTIVSIEDHKVIPKEGAGGWDSIGWDILIRMELLTSLSSYTTKKTLTAEEVVKLGIHISQALEMCARKNVIHRDIKPENIFVSDMGYFKLGDFGVARHIERMREEMSTKGTPTYMAPEVYNHKPYGPDVDLYSLGLVMYRYLNHNRVPFAPPFPETLETFDRTQAMLRRMNGEPLPEIPGINPALSDFVLKACAFDPKDRFKTATEFRTTLEQIAGVQPMAQIIEARPEPVKVGTEGKAVRSMRQEDDEGTVRAFAIRREATIAQPKAARPEVPAKIMNALSITGAVCAGILALLSIVSGNVGDMVFSTPMYAAIAALCFLTFRISALNLVVIVWLVCTSVFTALNFRGFDYSLLVMTIGILCVESLRSSSPKYKRALAVSLASCGAVIFVMMYMKSGASSSENFKALIGSFYGITLMLWLGAVIVMLPQREDGKVIAALSALQCSSLLMFVMMIVLALAGSYSGRLYNMTDATFVGLSPNRFAWWRHARFMGLIVQTVMSLCVVLLAAGRLIPEDFLGMMKNRGRSALVFGVSLAVIASGISLVLIL